jgi:hypothetical protein
MLEKLVLKTMVVLGVLTMSINKEFVYFKI